MADFTDFDFLYLIQTPFFYLGNPQKALDQLSSVEIDTENETASDLKEF
jgi:hypothetical protein